MSQGLDNLKHIVVLTMENRSFDHMLGGLKKKNPRINGLNGNESTNQHQAPVSFARDLARRRLELLPRGRQHLLRRHADRGRKLVPAQTAGRCTMSVTR